MFIFSATIVNFSYAASPKNSEQAGDRLVFDVEPPKIEHTPFSSPQKSDAPLKLEAIITDNQGVQSVLLSYRVKGMENYRVQMMRLSKTSPPTFVGIIPRNEIGTDTIEYFIQATDTGGNTVLRGGMLFPLSVAFEQPTTPNNSIKSVAVKEETGGLFDLPKNSNQTWAWIAGGVIVGALIASSGTDDSATNTKPGSGTISITAPPLKQ